MISPYYHDELAGITIYHGDCREVLPEIGHFDAVVTDPPYGVSFGGKATKWSRRTEGYTQIDDSPQYIRDVVVPLIQQFVIDGNRVVLTPGIRNVWLYPEPYAMGTIFYPAGSGIGRWGFTCSQPILYYGKDPYLASGKGHRPDSFSTNELAAENGHPCPKPIKTMRWLVNKATLPGETVLDPFAGSGTTGRAAKDLGRKAILIEVEERYCEIAAQGLAQSVLPLGVG